MSNEPAESNAAPKWKPIGRIERRVLGVLVEKAKTTPDAYPLTLNALTNGCNQKSNRSPQMNLEPIQVETALEKLRHIQAAIEVSGGGRVPKFRHLVYEWMGVNKPESAVMTELLLRGAQTIGELRGRAARMDATITDVATLQPIVQALCERGLVLALTPAGRGQMVTHGLYQPEELAKVKADVGISGTAAPEQVVASSPDPVTESPAATINSAAPTQSASDPSASSAPTADSSPADAQELQHLRQEIENLKHEISKIKSDVQDLWSNLS